MDTAKYSFQLKNAFFINQVYKSVLPSDFYVYISI